MSISIVYRNSQYGNEYFEQSTNILERAKRDNCDSIEINQVRICRSSESIW